MEDIFSRTKMLIGDEAFEILKKSRIAIFGIGGVGGYVFEALVRSGAGEIDIIDNDIVSSSNINRQIIATTNTIGLPKVQVAKLRALEINPNVKINAIQKFFLPENSDEFNFSKYDYVIDAIDTVSGKIEIVLKAQRDGVRVISSMGAGNKLDPTKFQIADIYKTSVCPLAKVMRQELKKRGVKKLKVVYSQELPYKQSEKRIPASIAFVPSVAGLIIAGEVVKDLILVKHNFF